MPANPDDIYVIGLSVKDAGGTTPSESSRGHFCFNCHQELWISNRGMAFTEGKEVKFTCQHCVSEFAGPEAVLPPEDEVVVRVNQARAEMGLPPMSRDALLEVAKAALFKKYDA